MTNSILKTKIVIFNKIISFIKSQLILEAQNIRYYNIVSFACGILFCFFSTDFTRYFVVLTIIMLTSLTHIGRYFTESFKKIITKFAIFFLVGVITANIKISTTPNITENFGTRNAVFNAKIDEIRLTSSSSYLTLTAINPPYMSLNDKKIKLKYDDDVKSLYVGDIVKIKTSLANVKYGIFPNDNSYENYAKFFGIVARGKIKELNIQKNSSNFIKKTFDIDRIRKNIQNRIYEVNDYSVGSGILIDILTGNNSFIPRDKLNNIRHSGCAHILAISGLHMSVIIGFVFIVFIHIFSLFPNIALKYNTKKLASIPACITCFIYLQLANAPISALRSFIMVFLGFLTLWFNKAKTSKNILFTTFFLILLISPHYILSPSFQMSFMAVFGLITIYNSDNIMQENAFLSRHKILKYIIGILMSSFVATLATVFFEIYHFKQYAWIGILSNIVVIPITEFIVLPIGFIGIFFNGTHIGDILYKISAFFAEYICKITDFTAHIQNSFILTPQMQLWQLGIIISAMTILFLSRTIFFRIIGITTMLIGILCYMFSPKIILVYNQNLNNIVFFENNNYYSQKPITNEYTKSVWSQNLGIDKILTRNENNKNLICFDKFGISITNIIQDKKTNDKPYKCVFTYKNKKYTITRKNNQQPVAVYQRFGRFYTIK